MSSTVHRRSLVAGPKSSSRTSTLACCVDGWLADSTPSIPLCNCRFRQTRNLDAKTRDKRLGNVLRNSKWPILFRDRCPSMPRRNLTSDIDQESNSARKRTALVRHSRSKLSCSVAYCLHLVNPTQTHRKLTVFRTTLGIRDPSFRMNRPLEELISEQYRQSTESGVWGTARSSLFDDRVFRS